MDSKLPVGFETLFYDLLKRINRLGAETKIATIFATTTWLDQPVWWQDAFGRPTPSTWLRHHSRVTEFHTFDRRQRQESWPVAVIWQRRGHALQGIGFV